MPILPEKLTLTAAASADPILRTSITNKLNSIFELLKQANIEINELSYVDKKLAESITMRAITAVACVMHYALHPELYDDLSNI